VIVAMKKATVITRRQEKQEALHKLRQLGILHLSAVPAHVESAQEWREKKLLLEKALALIAPLPAPGPESTPPPPSRGPSGPSTAAYGVGGLESPSAQHDPCWRNMKPCAR
jgi:hypothetical protein